MSLTKTKRLRKQALNDTCTKHHPIHGSTSVVSPTPGTTTPTPAPSVEPVEVTHAQKVEEYVAKRTLISDQEARQVAEAMESIWTLGPPYTVVKQANAIAEAVGEEKIGPYETSAWIPWSLEVGDKSGEKETAADESNFGAGNGEGAGVGAGQVEGADVGAGQEEVATGPSVAKV
ncbi:hypothetical protein MMC18_007885 [Xylographa bjoerkii]|nr:hypothetical protein [Xylographa bjoerkii]